MKRVVILIVTEPEVPGDPAIVEVAGERSGAGHLVTNSFEGYDLETAFGAFGVALDSERQARWREEGIGGA